MTEVIKISPILNIGEQVIDVRKLVDAIALESLITEKQIGTSTLPIPDLPNDIKISSIEREKIFQLIHHFLYLKFTPTPHSDSGSNFAYKVVSKHQPEDMVLVKKTNDRLELNKMIVPRELLQQPGRLDPDWMEIASFALIDNINQYAE